MGGQRRYSGYSKAIAVVAIVGFLFANAVSDGAGVAVSCGLLSEWTTWMILGVLRLAVLQVVWPAVTVYLYQDSGLLHHLLQVGAGLGPLVCTVIRSR